MLLYILPTTLCVCTKIHPSVSIKPRIQYILYDFLSRIHVGILRPFLSLLPRIKPFIAKKSTTDVLASDITRAFLVFLFRMAGAIPKSFLHKPETYGVY